MRFFPNPVMRAAIIVLSGLLCPGQFLMGAQTPGRLSEDLALERSAPAATDLPLDATQRLCTPTIKSQPRSCVSKRGGASQNHPAPQSCLLSSEGSFSSMGNI